MGVYVSDGHRDSRRQTGPDGCFGCQASGASTELPDLMLRLAAMFDPIVRGRLFELGKRRDASPEKAKAQLGWAPRPGDEAIMATARDMIRLKIV